ncbi:hypothetical protein Aph01nite_54980 [Acrocarpospora phusangensis]|uniref:Uncharacterized protein n=1 Tax=Acrocarpospora phusangensis TaxID=1070424 RepID=A0A919QEC7_9ACTN|nr:hypothetical protein [Acrocarpospora phusangensis]GIH27188.1 hypothetical protein Aph01nite_54980 [Acrocarpospora phusangensis]
MGVRAWRIVGGAFTVIVVVATAVTAYTEIEWRGGMDRNAPTWLLSQQHTEILTEVYAFVSPTLVVRAGENVRVDVETGVDGQLTVRRELTWTGDPPDVRQSWNGRTLRVDVSCRSDCEAVYLLTVPDTVEVERPGASPIAPGIP